MAKEAIRVLTRVAAMEWGRYGIRVNALCPLADTPGMDFFDGETGAYEKMVIPDVALGRLGDAEADVGRSVVYLCSDDAAYVTGTTLIGRRWLQLLAMRGSEMEPNLDNVRVEVADQVALVTLDRPPVNALDSHTWRQLAIAFDSLGARRDVNAAIFNATGKIFCAGVDLRDSPRRHRPDGRPEDGAPQGDPRISSTLVCYPGRPSGRCTTVPCRSLAPSTARPSAPAPCSSPCATW